jgi:hypothetical protein
MGILMGLALLLVVDSVSGFLGSSASLSGALPLTRGFRGEGSPPTPIPDPGFWNQPVPFGQTQLRPPMPSSTVEPRIQTMFSAHSHLPVKSATDCIH